MYIIDPIVRDADGYVEFARNEYNDVATMTPSCLGFIGMACHSGYLGSSLYVDVIYHEMINEFTKDLFKADLSHTYLIKDEDDSHMKYRFGEVRSFLEDWGITYRSANRAPMTWLTDIEGGATKRDAMAFLKGVVLGCYREEVAQMWVRDRILSFVVSGKAMLDGLKHICDLFGVEVSTDEVNMRMTFTDEDPIVEWFLNQVVGFEWSDV